MATKTYYYSIAKEYKTKKPSGLSVTRDGQRFTFSWKVGDKDYDGAEVFQYRINGGKWIDKSVGRNTSTYIDINFSQYYPSTGTRLNSVEFRIAGVRKSWITTKRKESKSGKDTIVKIYNYVYTPTLSDFEAKAYSTIIPSDPSISVSVQTNDNVNRCTFTVAEANPANTGNISRDVIWQTMLVPNCNTTNGASLTWTSSATGWQTGTMAAGGGTQIIDETSVVTGSGSYTRWFRAYARGVRGDSSKWIYSRHVYAAPNRANIVSVDRVVRLSTDAYTVTTKWNAPETVARPIDRVVLQYVKGTPRAGRNAPTDGWQDAVTVADTSGTDGVTIDVAGRCDYDEALFVRVNTYHDNRVTYGVGTYVCSERLTPPTDLSVTIDTNTNTADITVTNNCDIPDSFIRINYMTQKENFVIAVSSAGSGSKTIQNVKLPSGIAGQNITFTATAVCGSYRSNGASGGVPSYSVSAWESSSTISFGTSVPASPTNVTLQTTSTPGNIRISWTKTWAAANRAELTWADHADAWESTDEPANFIITMPNASGWYISGLETGVEWFARVRLGLEDDNGTTWGQYSKIVSIKLASAPVVPVLELSAGVITAKGTVDASWVYVTSDGTGQGSAKLAEVITSGGSTTYQTIATTTSAQMGTISAQRQGWQTGSTHLLAVRVTSGSGQLSDDWSAPVPVIVADAVTCTITQTSLETVTETIDDITETFTGLTEMPLTLTVTGAQAGGITSVTIERAEEYFVDRPDESVSRGYAGETIAVYSQQGEAQITITNDDLIGSLDDGAKYTLIATTQDSYGQTASASIDFRVKWDDQAIVPEANAEVNEEDAYAVLAPIAPAGASDTATCDIYRLSVDKPVLIYKGANFNEFYVDPFPTIGEYGGHRFVYRTENGDYITPDDTFAWVDLQEAEGDYLESEDNIIEWDTGKVMLRHNIDLSNSWSKDFTETQYLGGSVQGDWNPAIHREGSMSAVAIATDDQEIIQAMRRLATHAGICHLRTKDGSNIACDIQVSESYKQDNAHKIVEFTLKITRVDNQRLDGMTLEEWEKIHPIDPEDYATDNTPYIMRQTGGGIYDD